MATKKTKTKATDEVTVVKGSHLTVYTYPDGSTKLEWDDEALTRDVREALQKVESVTPVETKPKRKTKKATQ